MKKNGFTLIELLAVIVILAIIALIATPIILGIINDARKESNERSVELYASAVRNAIASYQLKNPNAPKTFSDLSVQYDGDVVCSTEELYEDGSFYITGCTVNGTEVEYTYGEKQELPSIQVYKPQYYSWGSGNVGEDLPDDAKTNVLEIDTFGYPFYLGLDVDSNSKVTAAYSCFIRNETEYCLKGNDEEAYATNKDIIKEAFADVLDDSDACSSESCDADGLSVFANSGGDVGAGDGGTFCSVGGGGYFECF